MANYFGLVVNFHIFFNYNFLQWSFVCNLKCAAIGLLLGEKCGAWFTEFTLNFFDPSI